MKKMGKIWLVITLFLVCALSGCGEKSAPEEDYLGEMYIRSSIVLKRSISDKETWKQIAKANKGLGAFDGMLPVADSYIRVELKRGSEARDVVYLTENAPEMTNPVITSKWMYYSVVFSDCGQRNDENVLAIVDSAYCYEKLVCFPTCYVCTNPDHPDCDLGAQRLGVDWDLLCDEACCEETLKYPREVEAAAAYKYNLYDDEDDHLGKPVTIQFCTRRVMMTLNETWHKYDGGAQEMMNVRKATIVGYVETEADKIIDRGIPMDKTSQEYQQVIYQLAHPVFYVVGQ